MTGRFDMVIVGAGSAGAVLAARLSENPDRQVLLLDAGPDFPEPADVPPEIVIGRAAGIGIITDSPSTPDDYIWRFPARANAEQAPRRYARGRLVGGSSAVNGQVFIRPLPEDFERWVAAGNDRWSYEDVLPFYRKLETHLDVDSLGERYHGRTGPIRARRYPSSLWCPPAQAFYDAARAHGFRHCEDDSHPDGTGVGPATHNNAEDQRQSVLVTYLREARGRANLTIRSRTTVQKVIIEQGRAVAVLAETDGMAERIEGAEIILCAGALATPQLLMVSGMGPAEHLRDHGIGVAADLPGVGRNLCEHPYIHLLWHAQPGAARPVTDPGHPVVLRLTTPSSPHRNDAKIYMHNSVPLPPDSELDASTIVGSLCNLDFVRSRGHVRLNGPGIGTEPEIEFNLLQDPDDQQCMLATMRVMLDLLRSPQLKPIVAGPLTQMPSEDELPAWLLANAQPAMHPSATCAMGPASDPNAVVDQEGRVHGVDGLRVVDASILPEVPRANLNATVMMLGERIATFL